MSSSSVTPLPGAAGVGASDTVEAAVAEIAAGRPVVVVDDPGRENECDLVFAAAHATPELLAFTVRYSSGMVCAPMAPAEVDRLALPPMAAVNEDPKGTAYTVSVDARDGGSTGISAADRARTLRVLADPASLPSSVTRPGHVFPLRAVPGGVLARAGHTEAGVELARLAGLPPVAGIAELVADDGSMLRSGALPPFLREHGLVSLTVADLAAYLRRVERQVRRVSTSRMPTAHGLFTAHGYLDEPTGKECVALVHGDVGKGCDVLVRVHSECLTGDAFGSARCDCGEQLDAAMARICRAGRGVVVYLRGHEGRGIGLLNKLRAYELQDTGADTVEANLALGLPVDDRDFAPAAQVLADLGVRSVRLLTNNPAKERALTELGVRVVARVPSATVPTTDNLGYLMAKRDLLGHDVPWLADGVGGEAARP
ncbi:MAG: bifunctional 3,4-dihydroxy-2-butanone-4-phosphate synthase/GTP cyclohydrolase II [Streptosporangiales bacterium]|nr:bifunctional 3,4-dihydroxy-2-butanone-4-phosphate synthase/GTP cyclohydrolase II [Streptosporangiales bacterium]